jgi:hypothetical protein
MDDSDFLWQCAFQSQGKDRLWIIPDRDDLFVKQRDGLRQSNSRMQTFQLSQQHLNIHEIDKDETVKVRIVEQRGQGVCDVIGGEVWEAALLLSAYLLKNWWPHNPYGSARVLELGSGVGLPSLLLAKLQQLISSQGVSSDRGNVLRSVTMTDFDAQLVANLSKAVNLQFSIRNITPRESSLSTDSTIMRNDDVGLCIAAGILDWELFVSEKDSDGRIEDTNSDDSNFMGDDSNESDDDELELEESYESLKKWNKVNQLLLQDMHHDQFDVLIGSALCYAPYHSNCLASLIDYYLHPNSQVKEIIIIQIHDREGFHTLLSRLKDMSHITFILEDVSEDVYDLASQFYRSLDSRPLQSESKEVIINDEKHRMSLRSEEEVNAYVFDYYFPLKPFAVSAMKPQEEVVELLSEDVDRGDRCNGLDKLHQSFKYDLLKTDRDAFKLLRIFKQQGSC